MRDADVLQVAYGVPLRIAEADVVVDLWRMTGTTEATLWGTILEHHGDFVPLVHALFDMLLLPTGEGESTDG